MKTFNLSRNSWHYKFAVKFTGHVDDTDICSYVRKIILNLVLATSLVAMIIVIAFIGALTLTEAVLGIAFSVFYQTWIMSDVGFLGIIFCFFGLTVFAFKMLQNKLESSVKVKTDGLLKLAYKSKKEKFCAKIKFI